MNGTALELGRGIGGPSRAKRQESPALKARIVGAKLAADYRRYLPLQC